MPMRSLLFFISVVISLNVNYLKAQTFVYGQLTGSPNMITTGWNLTGNAHIGDTPGDVDAFNNELLLTNNTTTQSGGVFYNTPINLTQCQKWTVDFEYRIWGGNAADGLAFCFIDVPPTGFVPGGGIGIPGAANGIKIVIDTYDNCSQGGTNPEIQIFNGIGYNECMTSTPKIQNSGGSLSYLRNSNYQPVKIEYNNGVVKVYVNNVLLLTGSAPVNFTGYMGFTASTGALYDLHSIRNVTIYTDQASSNAGVDVTTCSNQGVTIGTASNANYVYSWSPATGLSAANVANPVATITNTTGATITQTYTVTTSLASSPGLCPTTDQIVVTIHPSYTHTINQTSCSGSYVFNGQTLTQSGTYYDTLNTIHNCDSVVTLNLTLGTTPTISAGPDQTTCSDVGVSLGTASNPAYTYSWSPSTWLSSSNAVSPVMTMPNTSGAPLTQTYTLTVTDPSNPLSCPATDQVNVIIYPEFASTFADTVCTGGPYVFNGINYTTSGIYIDSAQTTHGCDSILTLNISISSIPTFSVPDQTICFGQSLTLVPQNGAPTAQYGWAPLGSLTPTISPSFALSPNTSINFYAVAIDPYLCSFIDTIQITVNPLPIVGLTANASTLCAYDDLQLNASGAQSYVWSGPLSFTTGNATQVLTQPISGVYQVLGTSAQGCQDSTQLTITVNPAPVLNISPDQGVCPGFGANVTVSGALNYVWADPQWSGTSIAVSPLTSTTYVVYGSNQYGCIDTAQSTVTVYPSPIATIVADPLVLTSDNPTVNFSNVSSNAAVSVWNFDDGSSSSETSEASFDYTFPFVEDQDYTVSLIVTSPEGCIDQTQVLIQIKGGTIYYVPNAFTPDGDELNNVFTPVFTSGFDPLTYHFEIYNRWGELVFESADPKAGWDGNMNYIDAPDGVYSYKINFTTSGKMEAQHIEGHVVLMR
ncbi:MAG: hypothetical protein RLZZ301_829 [Bacteroidota bacterium]|jgi:gliding motility-associated-like protein